MKIARGAADAARANGRSKPEPQCWYHVRSIRRWSLDFVSDTLSDRHRFRVLCVVDDFSRECLATVVDTSLGGVRVVREWSGWRSRAHYPK